MTGAMVEYEALVRWLSILVYRACGHHGFSVSARGIIEIAMYGISGNLYLEMYVDKAAYIPDLVSVSLDNYKSR